MYFPKFDRNKIAESSRRETLCRGILPTRRGGGVIVVKPRPGVYAIGYRSVSAQKKKRSGLTAIDTGWHSAVRLRAHFFFNNRLNTLVDPLLLLSRNVA